ncbi:hypothetical protein ACFE04_006847 [Oxalis oulophora]
MGSSLTGHVLFGLAFVLLGTWHLFNHVKFHILHPTTYTSSPWFPVSKLKYLELILILIACSVNVTFELFITPSKHQPLDRDFTIPSSHLHNFEHATISTSFILYATFAILLDKFGAKPKNGLTLLLASAAFSIELLLFHFHSTDHVGIEGHYHWFLQNLVAVSLATSLMGVGLPKSFLVSFVRSSSIIFQGVWLIVMGIMLWSTSQFIPKGCFMNLEGGRDTLRCSSDEALHRAKALVNLQFCWYSIGLGALVMSFYLSLFKVYDENFEYLSLKTNNNNKCMKGEVEYR